MTIHQHADTDTLQISGERLNRFDDESMREHKELPLTWTGSTHVEAKEQYKEALETSEDENRPQQHISSQICHTEVGVR